MADGPVININMSGGDDDGTGSAGSNPNRSPGGSQNYSGAHYGRAHRGLLNTAFWSSISNASAGMTARLFGPIGGMLSPFVQSSLSAFAREGGIRNYYLRNEIMKRHADFGVDPNTASQIATHAQTAGIGPAIQAAVAWAGPTAPSNLKNNRPGINLAQASAWIGGASRAAGVAASGAAIATGIGAAIVGAAASLKMIHSGAEYFKGEQSRLSRYGMAPALNEALNRITDIQQDIRIANDPTIAQMIHMAGSAYRDPRTVAARTNNQWVRTAISSVASATWDWIAPRVEGALYDMAVGVGPVGRMVANFFGADLDAGELARKVFQSAWEVGQAIGRAVFGGSSGSSGAAGGASGGVVVPSTNAVFERDFSYISHAPSGTKVVSGGVVVSWPKHDWYGTSVWHQNPVRRKQISPSQGPMKF